jgi:hypothetical protein
MHTQINRKTDLKSNLPADAAAQSRGRTRWAGWLVAGALLGAVALSSGCVAVVAGAGAGAAVAYVRGDLDATVKGGFEQAVRAANGAIVDLKFAKVSERKDALQAIIIARNAADKKIEIRVDQSGEKDSRVKIRVGVFGDEALSIAILDKIKANL